ncbi:PEGA domain-containing protein [Luteitalea sp. TBR-22]|uniref:PEGA domain-containing protein n=1 Tax=Luteitalea sp. TBR-22 TaxID=2802971 RepID=UPI001EF3F5BA|nr:PEGA domain-containing protein [Luteitalea sp. TBR-22]
MKSTVSTAIVAAFLLAGVPAIVAGQRPRNPGGDSGGSSSGSSGGTSTGSVAVPRDGGSTPWGGGGSGASRPSEPVSRPSGGSRTTRGGGGGGGGPVYGGGSGSAPGYSRPRNGAPVTGYGVPRGSVATLPPIISGPIYWGPGDWYFYPWGYGALGLGYFWDPWMWSGMGYGWGGYGYPWADPYWGGGGGGGLGGSTYAPADSSQNATPDPFDPDAPTGGVRLKVEPRDAAVYVDGFYAGLVDDFDGAMQKLKITQGSHRIELRLAGYETATFTVTIVAGETTSYKTTLKRQ